MNWSLEDAVVVQVLSLGVGGAVLALGGLWLDHRRNHRYEQILAGGAAVVLSVLAILLGVLDDSWGLAWPLLVLASVAALGLTLGSPWMRRSLSLLLRPRAVWGVLLLVGPAYSLLLAWHSNHPDGTLKGVAYGQVQYVPETEVRAFTDAGRPVRLFHYEEREPVASFETLLLEEERMKNQVIRLSAPDEVCNCHGWVFGGGICGVGGDAVDAILEDNGYGEVATPAADDVIVYRDHTGQVEHSGLVRFVSPEGLVLIESKWGPFGVFLHPPEAQPWGDNYHFFRSSRHGHLVNFQLPSAPSSVADKASARPPGRS